MRSIKGELINICRCRQVQREKERDNITATGEDFEEGEKSNAWFGNVDYGRVSGEPTFLLWDRSSQSEVSSSSGRSFSRSIRIIKNFG